MTNARQTAGGSAPTSPIDQLGAIDTRQRQPRPNQFSGTKALMLAVLQDGIRCYLSPSLSRNKEAERWINSPECRQPFSFFVVCETLGLEPEATRAAIQRVRACDAGGSARLRCGRWLTSQVAHLFGAID